MRQAIADAESELAANGRLLIRPSGTEPLIRVMAEGDDRSQVERIVDELVNVIGAVRSGHKLYGSRVTLGFAATSTSPLIRP